MMTLPVADGFMPNIQLVVLGKSTCLFCCLLIVKTHHSRDRSGKQELGSTT